MIHAYDKSYLPDVQKNLGAAFDIAVNGCSFSPDDFYNLFITSKIASNIENGSPKYLAGVSGTELAEEIFFKCGLERKIPVYENYDRTPEYWGGWILAYFQWDTDFSFTKIHNVISMEKIISMYNPLHEAPEEKFVDVVKEIIASKQETTNLHKLRKAARLTQAELAELSGVNLRTLQQYEVRAKDINMASGQTINALARALCCNFYDVMELDSE